MLSQTEYLDTSVERLGAFVLHAFLGSLFIAALAQIKIPFYPIPATLQTLAIFMIALQMKPSKALAATLLYLAECSIGLPVLAGGVAKSFWLGSFTAGYLISFPIAAFVCSYIYHLKKPSFLWGVVTLFLGQAIIFSIGVAWLSFYFGVEKAMMVGFFPFVISGIAKVTIAASSRSILSYFRN